MIRFISMAAGLVASVLMLANGALAQPQGDASKGTWSNKTPLPTTRNETSAVTVNGKIYLIGGNYPSKKYDVADNAEYDTATDQWRMRAPMPSGLNHLGTATLNGKIYVVGGFTSNGHRGVTDKAYEYDIAGDTWRTLAPLSSFGVR